jgi:hypothetical protein
MPLKSLGGRLSFLVTIALRRQAIHGGSPESLLKQPCSNPTIYGITKVFPLLTPLIFGKNHSFANALALNPF